MDITGQWREKRSTWFSNRCLYFFSVLVMCHRPTGQNTCGRGFRKSYTLEQTHFCELYIPFKETTLYCSHFSILTTQVITFRDLKHGNRCLFPWSMWSIYLVLMINSFNWIWRFMQQRFHERFTEIRSAPVSRTKPSVSVSQCPSDYLTKNTWAKELVLILVTSKSMSKSEQRDVIRGLF